MIYEDLLTVVVRMQARRQHASVAESFRARIKTALAEVERNATAAGYSGQDIRDTNFAVVAFLDSVVLHSSDPIRPEWERQTLQEELFGQSDAGVVFFEKLDDFRSRADSEQLADVLEVYLLCLLLGFEGRYSGNLRGELDSISERVRRRIDNIRGITGQLSPSGILSTSPMAPRVPTARRARHFRLMAVAAASLAITILLFLGSKVNLIWTSSQLRSKFF
jgi:type VI secretion system protein ImpK